MRLPVVVVYRKSTRGRKYYMQVFTDLYVDDIIDSNKRKPPIPHEYDLVEIGLGESYVERYKEDYNATLVENE